MCIPLCTTVIQNTAQNSSDNLPSYPPDNHHCLDVVYWRGGGAAGDKHRKLIRRKEVNAHWAYSYGDKKCHITWSDYNELNAAEKTLQYTNASMPHNKKVHHRLSRKSNWKRSLVILAPLWPEKTNMESRATASAKLQHVGGMSPVWFTFTAVTAGYGIYCWKPEHYQIPHRGFLLSSCLNDLLRYS